MPWWRRRRRRSSGFGRAAFPGRGNRCRSLRRPAGRRSSSGRRPGATMAVQAPRAAILAASTLLAMPPRPMLPAAASFRVGRRAAGSSTLGQQLRFRVAPRIVFVDAVDVGEEHQQVGVAFGGEQGGEAVVVAEDLPLAGGGAVGHGVVFVEDRQHSPAQQGFDGGAQVQVALAEVEVLFGEQHLGGEDLLFAEQLAPEGHQPGPGRPRRRRVWSRDRARSRARAAGGRGRRRRRRPPAPRGRLAIPRPGRRRWRRGGSAAMSPEASSISTRVPSLTTSRRAAATSGLAGLVGAGVFIGKKPPSAEVMPSAAACQFSRCEYYPGG